MRKFKVVLIAVTILIGANVSAQNSPVTFGVRAGVNLSTIGGDYTTDNYNPKVGFNAGVTVDMPLSPTFYLMSGLNFTTKGTRESYRGITGTLNLMYLQLPLHLGYKLEIANGTRLVLHAGPYVAYGVGGDASFTIEGVNMSVGSFSDELGLYDRFDLGVGIGVGLQFPNRMTAGLGFDMGLVNIARNEHNITQRNMNAHLTVGFRF